METLENTWQKAADNIQKLQEKQKKRHNNQLSEKPVEFKIEDKVLLHHTKVKKQWSGKFDSKWDRLFHIKKILGNRTYKLRTCIWIKQNDYLIQQYWNNWNNLTTQARAIYQLHTGFQNRPEILLNPEINSIIINQMGKITNTQFEELQNKIAQVILEKKVQEILKDRKLELGDLNGA
ncbi:hypothetical protein G9A89_007603 [Geosiphon pyriformis]|nr:hypothetical protein G9A89_007603 [Geosiphon pyriformis]